MREDGGCSEDRRGRMRPCCLEVKEMVKERRMFYEGGRRLQRGQAGEDASPLLPGGQEDGEGEEDVL